MPTVWLNSSYSSTSKSRIWPSWKHIPSSSCWTPPSGGGKGRLVQPFVSMSSSPSLRPPCPLKSCPSFASHILAPTIAIGFFQLIVATPFNASTFFWWTFHSSFLAFPPSLLPFWATYQSCSRFPIFLLLFQCRKIAHWEFMEPKVLSILISRFYSSDNSFLYSFPKVYPILFVILSNL